jgi:stearoyl-CoA desaturase (delta-9 desaturase)
LAKVLRVAPVPRVAEPKLKVDMETLQAVINNRYDLLARYARDLRRVYADELRNMRVPSAERDRFAGLKRWLRKGDVTAIPPEEQQVLREAVAQSRVLKTLIDMRADLASTWERSSASREQLLSHLQDWIARAEASGIRALQNLALRIRSYAPASV